MIRIFIFILIIYATTTTFHAFAADITHCDDARDVANGCFLGTMSRSDVWNNYSTKSYIRNLSELCDSAKRLRREGMRSDLQFESTNKAYELCVKSAKKR